MRGVTACLVCNTSRLVEQESITSRWMSEGRRIENEAEIKSVSKTGEEASFPKSAFKIKPMVV